MTHSDVCVSSQYSWALGIPRPSRGGLLPWLSRAATPDLDVITHPDHAHSPPIPISPTQSFPQSGLVAPLTFPDTMLPPWRGMAAMVVTAAAGKQPGTLPGVIIRPLKPPIWEAMRLTLATGKETEAQEVLHW